MRKRLVDVDDEHRRIRVRYVDDLPAVLLTPRAEQRAREVQSQLVRRGQHRSAGVPALLIAATAEAEA